MKIGVIGSKNVADELGGIQDLKAEIQSIGHKDVKDQEIILCCLDPAQNPEIIQGLKNYNGLLGFNTIYGSALSQLDSNSISNKKAFSFLGIGGFLSRAQFELGIPFNDSRSEIVKAFEDAGFDPIPVLDRVGLVTGRVLAMIINEAYFTVMEGTAEKKDIDVAMKLGTNYPFGPFELMEKAGVESIFSLINHLFSESSDERYRICPLMRDEVMKARLG